jgi:hypothetical protein
MSQINPTSPSIVSLPHWTTRSQVAYIGIYIQEFGRQKNKAGIEHLILEHDERNLIVGETGKTCTRIKRNEDYKVFDYFA